jgi:hypothetical protein
MSSFVFRGIRDSKSGIERHQVSCSIHRVGTLPRLIKGASVYQSREAEFKVAVFFGRVRVNSFFSVT